MFAQGTAQQHRSIVADTVMTLFTGTTDVPVDTEISYTSRDPFAVRVVFNLANSPSVEWVFSRDLLIGGLESPTGVGDVQVFPSTEGVTLELSSPAGCAQLQADGPTIAMFVEDILAAVPLGAEHRYFDLDQEIGLLANVKSPRREV